MSVEQTTLEWLQAEHAAVVLKFAEVQIAKQTYLASYEIAKARLEKGKAELELLIAAQV